MEQPVPDDVLARRAARGDRASFERLVERYADALLAVIESRVGDPHTALDLLQDVWIKVLRALPDYRPNGSFRSWLFAVALNRTRDHKRRTARRQVVSLDEVRDRLGSGEPAFDEAALERAAIRRALDEVPEPYRTALQLVDVLGFSYDEAAESLGCAVGTAKSRVHRGRAAFRAAYERQEPAQRRRGDERSVQAGGSR